MRSLAAVSLVAVTIASLCLARASSQHPQSAEIQVAVYDPNPDHLWNRVYAALFVRKDQHGSLLGRDSLDPPLWRETEHLLSQPSHTAAVRVLDEFLLTHGETLIPDPLPHAAMQHDLWAIFDWSIAQYSARERPNYANGKQELQLRLAEALRRLALTPDQIKSLPDNYTQAVASGAFAKQFDPEHPEQAFLPPDLFDPRGPWVCIQPSPESDSGVARMHIETLSGRSDFFVFVRLPGGRKATFEYFRSLWESPQPYVQGPELVSDQAPPNPDLPSFPAGTEVALVRRMMLIDNQGDLQASPITESVQIRIYRSITAAHERNFGSGNPADIIRESGQNFYEVTLSRPLLFAGKNGGLRAIGPGEREFSVFQTMGTDWIERTHGGPEFDIDSIRPRLQTCAWCHNGGGIRSLNSRAALLRPNRMQKEPENPEYGPIYWENASTLSWKSNRYDWGLLNGYWKMTAQKP